MARNFSPVAPFNAAVKYVDPKTSSGLSEAGYRQFSSLASAQGIAPTVTEAPTGEAQTGAFVFHPDTATLHMYDGTAWRSVKLT